MYRLVDERYEEVKGTWEEHYEGKYGRWRGFVEDVVYAFTDCGDLGRGFARVYCDACRSEYLLAFSCARRGFCCSCAAKRAAIFGAFLQEEVLEEVGHCMWTLTWHPHIHALSSRGGWDREGIWHPVPYVDEKAAELLLRQKVLSFLSEEGLLGQERLELLESWKSGHTGFSAHNRVTVTADDSTGLERLARYLLRPALSLERLELDGAVARYRHKQARRADGEAFDAGDLLARLLMHVPEPRLHLVRYYGHYSSAARSRRHEAEQATEVGGAGASPLEDETPSPGERRRLRRQWARLIRRIYEADPLLCQCGHQMRVISFLTDPPVVDKILRHLEQKGSPESERGPPGTPAHLAS